MSGTKERRLRALAGAIAAYEKELGPISADEISTQDRADREAARVIRGGRPSTKAPRPARSRAR